jgi:heptosyltransferase-2
MLAQAGISAPFVVLCPGATGLHRGREKTWRDFDRLTRWLIERGERVVALPGPGERTRFEAVLPGATILPETDVATFGALLAASRLVIANDSGPGHLAAAVGAHLISLFGVTEVAKTRPWGRDVTVVGSDAGWPSFDDVIAAVDAALPRAATHR